MQTVLPKTVKCDKRGLDVKKRERDQSRLEKCNILDCRGEKLISFEQAERSIYVPEC